MGKLLAAYVEACGDVFDLSSDRPFLQTEWRGMRKRGLCRSLSGRASRTNVCHWRHPPEALWT